MFSTDFSANCAPNRYFNYSWEHKDLSAQSPIILSKVGFQAMILRCVNNECYTSLCKPPT